MRVVSFARHGAPEVLSVCDVAVPVALNDEVLVRVWACGINHGVDGRVRRDGGGRSIKLPHVLGSEVAGEIAGLGSSVTGLSVGDRVVVAPWVTCGRCRACLSGRDNSCESAQMIGVSRWGGYAEFITVPSQNAIVFPREGSLSFLRAAALPIGYVTAWHLLRRRTQLAPGETILILGAAGIVGTAAIQLSKLLGARVIAAASTAAKRDFAIRQGADHAIDYTMGDFSERVMALTEGRGVDVAIDHIGEATWERTLRSVTREGRVGVCGATTGFDVRINSRNLWRRNISLHFSNSGTRLDLSEVLAFAAQGLIDPVIADVLPFSRASIAHHRLEDRALIGKLMLDPTIVA